MDPMKSIQSWDDLRSYGIDLLTGEACGYAMRYLCDVTAAGAALLGRFFGGHVAIKEGSNWNRGSVEDPHVGSIMLTQGVFSDLAAFVLLETTRDTAIVSRDGGAVELSAEYFERYRKLDAERPEGSTFEPLIRRVWRRPTERTVERNEHAMSGRVI